MRSRLEDKLRLDGVTWESFTLKPNLQNLLRLRLRALRDQLGYKLPALLQSRCEVSGTDGVWPQETLFGDDAEADAFVYSLYSDIAEGQVEGALLEEICRRGRVYSDVRDLVLFHAKRVPKVPTVERILIHLEGQSSPLAFDVYGPRLIPFYNYFQAALVVYEDGRISPTGLLRVADEMIVQHHFDGDGLARSYLDLTKRGHLRGLGVDALCRAFEELCVVEVLTGAREVRVFVSRLPELADQARAVHLPPSSEGPNYLALVEKHNRRSATRDSR
jgi:hypothetical protein